MVQAPASPQHPGLPVVTESLPSLERQTSGVPSLGQTSGSTSVLPTPEALMAAQGMQPQINIAAEPQHPRANLIEHEHMDVDPVLKKGPLSTFQASSAAFRDTHLPPKSWFIAPTSLFTHGGPFAPNSLQVLSASSAPPKSSNSNFGPLASQVTFKAPLAPRHNLNNAQGPNRAEHDVQMSEAEPSRAAPPIHCASTWKFPSDLRPSSFAS
jgi:hypothetical protein